MHCCSATAAQARSSTAGPADAEKTPKCNNQKHFMIMFFKFVKSLNPCQNFCKSNAPHIYLIDPKPTPNRSL